MWLMQQESTSTFVSLHAVTQMHGITHNPTGLNPLDGDWTFPCRDAWSHVQASRIDDAPIAAAVIAPGKMKMIDRNDLHVSLAHPRADSCVRRHAKWALTLFEISFRVLVARRRRGGK